jgi:hypothetical protein
MTQPHPEVTSVDVERIVRRDFPAERVDEVLATLNEFGTKDWHRELDRVRMATLKLAAGNLEDLRGHVAAANMDYRDVLAEAQYPLYTKHWFHIKELPADEQQRIIDADWKQYQDWYTRP